jgi:hypothetical protein
MLIQHHHNTTFHDHQLPGYHHGMRVPRVFNSALEAAVEEALA